MKEIIKKTVRLLRKNQTKSEKLFWGLVRNRKIAGKKFVRQYPIAFDYYGKKKFFVADFYCHDSKLIIELDGRIHEKQKEYDQLRDFIIGHLGISVLRFSNDELCNNPQGVILKLIDHI